jgi:FkbH-like protein
MTAHPLLHETLGPLLAGDAGSAVDRLTQWVAAHGPSAGLHPLLRFAIHRPGQSYLYYLKVLNLWKRLGRPALKPNATPRKILLLTDYTADNLAPLLTLFAAAYGVELEVEVPPFNSVEQFALAAPCDARPAHLAVMSLSEHWLERYFGTAALVARSAVQQATEMIARLIAGLKGQGTERLLVTNFSARAYAAPAGMVSVPDAVGWNLAIAQINVWLADRQDANTHVIDVADALNGAGGRAAAGRMSYFRSKMAFEAAGTVAVAREIAIAVAQLAGKAHRALVTDWDNTLWGGEVAEAGSHGIVCGQDSPDGLAFLAVQNLIRGLTATGVLIAGVSRNDPAVASVLRDNTEVALKESDFASLQIGFGPKSAAIGQVAKELGFGPEFMTFLDDSLFELAEAVATHPDLDVLLAGPEPEVTLRTLSESRFFHAVALSSEDLQRGGAARAFKEQRDLQAGFTDLESFLREIRIRIDVSGLTEANLPRVEQLFQKSNQFNLTTRRHSAADLKRLLDAGGSIGVFSYEDTFGSQGVISVVLLVPDGNTMRIDSWLMSCRVLNRTVEQAVFAWMIEQAAGRDIVGEYLPTAKNGLVRDLYRSLGFELVSQDVAGGRAEWRYPVLNRVAAPPKYFAHVRQAA